ncbi:MAG: prepilin-type N-terminal cleavage/methylation domain-containing protein [Synergistaceae bacterium]|nr:prepilin-type N-terminal cleavage/methylation domain-containing protein [Synergistaceae bacterium]
MRRSKGFSLIELMTAMVVYGIFLVMLAGSFYALTSFATRSQQVLLARERGRKVIDYIDQRIRTAGLGMWELGKFSEVQEALSPLTSSGKPLYNSRYNGLRLPVAITYSYSIEDKRNDLAGANPYKTLASYKDGIWYGNILTLIYAERETDTTPDTAILRVVRDYTSGIIVPLVPTVEDALDKLLDALASTEDDEFWEKYFFLGELIFDKEEGETEISTKKAEKIYQHYKDSGKSIKEAAKATLDRMPGTTKTKIALIANNKHVALYAEGYNGPYEFMTGENEFVKSDFVSSTGENFKSWAVTAGTGVPILTEKNMSSTKKVNLTPQKDGITIPNGDELLYLKFERLFTSNPSEYDTKHGQPYRNLYVQKPKGTDWGNINPFEAGILEIYMEMDEKNNIFHLWVLSTGGRDTIKHECPKDWPNTTTNDRRFWRDDFAYEVLYVSKASWKLNNLREGFEWN